jgi:excisionase family DNA binding protein
MSEEASMETRNRIPGEILNVKEAADLLHVTKQTIKNYIYSGKLKSIKTPGGHHRIRKADLRALGFPVD